MKLADARRLRGDPVRRLIHEGEQRGFRVAGVRPVGYNPVKVK